MITNSKEILSQDEKTALRERIQDICKKAVSELMDPTSQMSDEERAQYEQKIFQKLKQGKRLSSAEMNYLQIHNPTMYQKALRVQNAKERLQTRLEHCRSKEEANDVIAMEMSAVSDKDPDREYMLAGLQPQSFCILLTFRIPSVHRQPIGLFWSHQQQPADFLSRYLSIPFSACQPINIFSRATGVFHITSSFFSSYFSLPFPFLSQQPP